MADINFCADNFLKGLCTPSFLRAIIFPHHGWSAIIEMMMRGIFALRAAAVVPTPPCIMAALQRGNSHWWLIDFTLNKRGCAVKLIGRDHPRQKIKRWVVVRSSSVIMDLINSGSGIGILPKPI